MPTALILAAGQGTRMKSALPKVLHPVAGRPMIRYVVDAARGAGADRILVVVGYGADQVRAGLDGVEFVHQAEQLGTGHAVLAAATQIEDAETVLVLPGDVPLLTAETLKPVLERQRASDAAAVLLTAILEDPRGYGRIVRADDGRVLRIVEEADATDVERSIREVNTGVYAFRSRPLLEALRRIGRSNRQGEYYLVDVVPYLLEAGHRVDSVTASNALDTLGVNDRAALARANSVMRQRLVEYWMGNGVTVVDPATTFIDADVTIGQDTVIEPFTFLRGATRIGCRCRVGPGAQITDAEIGDDCTIGSSVLEACRLGAGVTVGPFNHLRPGTVLHDGVKVGNFAELKNTVVGEGSKVPHHSYLGDAAIGRGVNIGAGVVTVNYDGTRKHRTEIADGAFIGCNVNLIAPVRVGREGYLAAGSTVDQDVPDEALAIARARQTNKEGWVRRRRKAQQRSDGEEA